MDEEKTKGRTWNGYVCPGCRTVFRVAADFIGADVMCPSCKETLRLPKTPEEVPPHTIITEKSTAAEPAAVSHPAQPVSPADLPQEAGPSALQAMLANHDGRLKLGIALLLPLALVLGVTALLPPRESASGKIAREKAPTIHAETTPEEKPEEKPAPPPPPVAVSEMPVPPPPALPQPEEMPVPEVAVVQPVPEPTAPIIEPAVKQVESAPQISEPGPEPIAAVETPDDGLVEAIPATRVPEQPAAPVVVQPEPETAAAPAELIHTVARGDTLNRISRKYQVTAVTIKKANGMKSDSVMLGQKLKIPGAIAPAAETAPPTVVETPAQAPQADRSHTVARGDTLDRIARKYRVTPQQIMQANGMKNDVVRLGRKLVIPAAP